VKKEEVEQFKRDLVSAFENRKPNTTSLEIMRLLDRFPPDMRSKMREEWREQANPERAWADAHIQDFEFHNSGSMTVLLLLLAEHHPAFAFSPEQWAALSEIDDELEEVSGDRPFTDPVGVLNRHGRDDGPGGMD